MPLLCDNPAFSKQPPPPPNTSSVDKPGLQAVKSLQSAFQGRLSAMQAFSAIRLQQF